MSLADLHEEREFLLGSLADLERERAAGEIDADDYRSLHDDYTARAAAVLRAIQKAESRPGGSRAGSVAPPVRARGWQRGVAAAVVIGMVGATLVGVLLFATDRDPGSQITGEVPATVGGRLALAHELEAQGEAVEALKLYDSVLQEDPGNPEALAYRGWLLRLAGLLDEAQESFDRAVVAAPGYPDARFFRGVLLLRDRREPAAAMADFDVFLAANPPAEVAEAVRGLREEAAAAAAGALPVPPAAG